MKTKSVKRKILVFVILKKNVCRYTQPCIHHLDGFMDITLLLTYASSFCD